VNPKLRLSVTPSPRNAPLQAGSPCHRVAGSGLIEPCAFGSSRPSLTFALIGDSHAAHLRTAVTTMANDLGWRGLAITRDSCAFAPAGRPLPEPYFTQCLQWKQQLPQYLAAHPEITTVFVGQLTRDIAVPEGPDPFGQQVAGYEQVWNSLPATVKHVIVVRDTPEVRVDTFDCVSRAMRRHRPAGTACRVPRAEALHPDPAATAADQLGSPRVRSVDLTNFFCDARYCYPVVGGVLVYKDITHLTPTFTRTLAPYLERATLTALAG
jgi:hypothetical protein